MHTEFEKISFGKHILTKLNLGKTQCWNKYVGCNDGCNAKLLILQRPMSGSLAFWWLLALIVSRTTYQSIFGKIILDTKIGNVQEKQKTSPFWYRDGCNAKLLTLQRSMLQGRLAFWWLLVLIRFQNDFSKPIRKSHSRNEIGKVQKTKIITILILGWLQCKILDFATNHVARTSCALVFFGPSSFPERLSKPIRTSHAGNE